MVAKMLYSAPLSLANDGCIFRNVSDGFPTDGICQRQILPLESALLLMRMRQK